jgi:hypothetical protein
MPITKGKKIELLGSPKRNKYESQYTTITIFLHQIYIQGKITTYTFRQKNFLQQTRRLNIRRERKGFFWFVFPQYVPSNITLSPYALPKVLPFFHLYRWGQGGDNPLANQNLKTSKSPHI